jgi:hypothetical protein
MVDDAELDEVDDYIAQHKSLLGYAHGWEMHFGRDWQVRWPIVDAGGVESGELCLTVARDGKHGSICCLLRGRLIYRLDVAPLGECKTNWHTAWKQNLPAEVCGSHVHGWPENRAYVKVNGFGKLPVRRPIDGIVATLQDGIGWVAEDLNIHIAPDQRDLELPSVELL